MSPPLERRDNARLWRDTALGAGGVDLLAGDFYSHAYRPHFHEEVVIATFVDGAQRHRVGRHEGVAVAGNLLVIPAGETHSGQAAAKDGGWSYRAFYPSVETLQTLRSELVLGRRSLDFSGLPLRQHSRLARHLAKLHMMLERDPDPLGRQQAFASAMSLVAVHLVGSASDVRATRKEPRSIRLAIEYARENFQRRDLDVSELARAAHLSPYHFMRSFRATTGVTAHQYVVHLRLREARNLLARGLPASLVAQQVGFADQAHLIRHFRATFAVTPGSFARLTRNRGAFAGHADVAT
jgi:AraC-like DNA-binding protein